MDNSLRTDYEMLRKSLNLSTSGAGNLQPQVLTSALTEYVKILPNIRNYIKRVDWPTMAYNWNSETIPGAAQAVADAGTIPFSDSTYARGMQQLSQIYSLFQVTRAAKLGAEPYIDVVASRLMSASKQLVRQEDNYILNGEPIAGNPGLIAACTATAPTSAVGGSGKTLSHALLDQIETYQNAGGFEVDAWFVSKNVYALLKTVAYNSVRFTNITPESEVMIGYSQGPSKALMFNGKPVVLDYYMYNGADNILAVSLDPDNLVTAVREEPIVLDFTNVTPQFDGDSYRVQEFCTSVLKNPNSAVALTNVVVPAASSF